MKVSRQAVTKWGTDKGLPDIDNLIAISKMMNVTLDELVSGGNEIVEKASWKRAGNANLSLGIVVVFFIVSVVWIIIG